MSTPETLPEFLTEKDLADLIKVAPATLRRWRWAHTGVRAIRLGGCIRYKRADVLAFIEDAPQSGGSE